MYIFKLAIVKDCNELSGVGEPLLCNQVINLLLCVLLEEAPDLNSMDHRLAFLRASWSTSFHSAERHLGLDLSRIFDQ